MYADVIFECGLHACMCECEWRLYGLCERMIINEGWGGGYVVIECEGSRKNIGFRRGLLVL